MCRFLAFIKNMCYNCVTNTVFLSFLFIEDFLTTGKDIKMKITPVKNYKKPRYAALAMAVAATFSGCAETEIALDGDVAVVSEPTLSGTVTTASEPAVSGTVTTTTETEFSETITTTAPVTTTRPTIAGTITTTTETTTRPTFEGTVTTTTEPTLSGTVTTTRPTLAGTITTTTEPTLTGTVTTTKPIKHVTSLQGTVTTVDDETDFPAEEIAEENIVEIATEGIVVAPEDTLTTTEPDEPFELEGDVAVSEEFTEEGEIAVAGDDYTYEDVYAAEEFSLAGDIAVVPDYESANTGMEYSEEYINTFREYGIFLTEKPGDEWGPSAAVFKDKPFILSLEGLRHSLYISFYDSADKDFTDELRYHGMIEFEYGYYGGADIDNEFCVLLFIDVSTDHYNHIGDIAGIMQNAGIPGGNAEQKSIEVAYEKMVNDSFNISEIMQAFEERGCTLNPHTDGDYLIDYIGFELNKEVPLPFDSDTHKVYIMAYDSENPYDPIANGLKENKAPETMYGAVMLDTYGYTYIFLDVSKFEENGCYETACAAALEELETK